MNVSDEEGAQLAKVYHVGSYFPLFVLADGNGDIITRWTGYTSARRFIVSLNKALADRITIKQRTERHRTNPNTRDALFLANYSKSIGEFLSAIDYYRQIQKLSGRDYSMQIFESSANAAWSGLIPFDTVMLAADVILKAKNRNNRNVQKIARLMGNLARKLHTTDKIARYIEAGIEVTAKSQEAKTIESHYRFLADKALYIAADTAEALQLEKESLGKDWQTNPTKFYSFGLWCYQRGINLEEAESYVRRALERASSGYFKAKHHDLLAEISFALGNTEEAIRQTELALQEEPSSEFYEKQLQRFRKALEEQ